MSLENGMTPADFAAINGNDGFCGNGAWWLILLFLFWGFNGNGYGYGGGNTAAVGADLQRGFDQNALMTQIDGIQTRLNDNALTSMQAAYNNQIASMNQSFANQQALDARLGAMEMQLQNCCCENRANVADLKYTVATENCADRNALQLGVRDIIENQNNGFQKILDFECQNIINAKDEKIQSLENQLNMANFQASQVAQTATIKSFFPATTTATAGN